MDLAIGSHGYGAGSPLLGAVSVLYRLSADTPSFNVKVITGLQAYSSFGFSITTADLNQDSIDDLIIGAPTAQGEFLDKKYYHDKYRGLVYVYLGSLNQEFSNSPDSIIEGNSHEQEASLGHSLFAADLDGDGYKDLIIGSPFAYGGNGSNNQNISGALGCHGLITVFMSSVARNWRNVKYNVNEESDWLVRGDNDFDIFGWSFAFLANKESPDQSILVVSAPGFNQSHGKIIAYTGFRKNLLQRPTVLFSISGYAPLTEFGRAMTFGRFYADSKYYLAVSSPTENGQDALHIQAGMVRVISISGLNSNTSIGSIVSLVDFVGDQAFGRMGMSLASAEIKSGTGVDDIVIGQTTGFTLPGGFEAGNIYVYSGGSSFPVGVNENPFSSTWFAVGKSKSSRLGTSLYYYDFDGDGILDVIASAPRQGSSQSETNQESGVVYYYHN